MRSLLWATCVALLSACSPESSGEALLGDGPAGGKADAPATLEPTSLSEIIRCRGVIDPSTSFAAADRLRCTMPSLPGVNTHSWVEVMDARPDIRTTVSNEGDGERDVLVSYRNSYPLRVRVSVSVAIPGQREPLYFGQERTFANPTALGELTATRPWRVGLPARLDEVAIYPTLPLAASLDGPVSIEVRYAATLPIVSSELAIGSRASTELRIARHESFQNAAAMRAGRFLVLVPETGEPNPLEITIHGEHADYPTSLRTTGPGYYLLRENGEARLVAPSELPTEEPKVDAGMAEDAALMADAASDADAAADADAAVDADTSDAAGAADVGVDVPRVDPCAGACAADEACVAARCVKLELQVQDYWSFTCQPARAVCEENVDCASGHVCAGGLCRRLAECQVQDYWNWTCQPARAVCEENADCASGHVCAGGLCRRRSECQVQDYWSSTCQPARAVCEDNADCADSHRCEASVCKHPSC